MLKPSKQTRFAGVPFRSKLENTWARALDNWRIRWIYEPFTINVDMARDRYTPDFYLPDDHLLLEIKPGRMVEEPYRHQATTADVPPAVAGYLDNQSQLVNYYASRTLAGWPGFPDYYVVQGTPKHHVVYQPIRPEIFKLWCCEGCSRLHFAIGGHYETRSTCAADCCGQNLFPIKGGPPEEYRIHRGTGKLADPRQATIWGG